MPASPLRRPLFPFLIMMAGSLLLAGCASTHRFVVDPAAVSGLAIEKAMLAGDRWVLFAGDGGAFDPAAKVVRGRSRGGGAVEVPLERIYRFWFRGPGESRSTIQGHPAALTKGARWRPDGRVRRLVLLSGTVVDLQRTPTEIDAPARVVRYLPAGRPAVEVPFAEILYVQVRDTHPGRTALCVLGLAFVGFGIGFALSGPVGLGP